MDTVMDFVQKVKEFNEIQGTTEKFDSRKCALYTGLILEEVSELIESYNSPELQMLFDQVHDAASQFKAGKFDHITPNVDRVSALDAAVDISVVALGMGIAVGSDIAGACHAVASNNLAKFPIVNGKRVVLRDETGKVKKPPGFCAPELTEYLRN